MANTDADHDTNEQAVRRTWFILAVLLVIIVGGYYWSVSGNQPDEPAKEQATTSDQQEDKAKEAPDKVSADDRQAAIREAAAAAQRGEPSETLAAEGDKAFTYVAGSGESYTGLARRAIASSNDKLSPAERIAAETKLTQDAGDQALAAGQEVTLSKSAVEAAVEWAQSLTEDQKAAWQPYADLVAW